MNTNNTRVFSIMTFIFWLIFIGLLIQAGSTLIAFIVSFNNPELANTFYLGEEIFTFTKQSNYGYVSFLVAFPLIKAYLAYLVIEIFSRIDLQEPFTPKVAHLISKLSHVALGAGLLAMIAQGYSKWLVKFGTDVMYQWGSGQYLFFAGIIYVIALIFQRGVDLQAESELTI